MAQTNFKIEPTVEKLAPNDYKQILREKWGLFHQGLNNETFLQQATQCLERQANYIERNLFTPLEFHLGYKTYVFLQVNGQNFSSNEEKKQFLKEIHFLRKVDFNLFNEEPLDLQGYIDSVSTNSNDQVVLVQIFFKK